MKPNLRPPTVSTSTQGMTLVEVLVGIIVAGILVTLIAPIVVLATATRLQTTRAEQAANLAQGEIDAARTLITQGVASSDEASVLPPEATVASGSKFSELGAPSATVSESTNPDDISKARIVDVDDDNSPDFLIQTFRDAGTRFDSGSVDNQLASFCMGVRVYSAIATDNLGSLGTEPASLGLTSSMIETQTRPLAVLYTNVSRSDIDVSLIKLRSYLNANDCS